MFGCASYRPILDENPKFLRAGEAQAESDIDMCEKKAERYLEKHEKEITQKQMGRSAAAGAVVGGVVGAGTGAGSAYLGNQTKGSLKPDELKQQYITNCLQRLDYAVIGWK